MDRGSHNMTDANIFLEQAGYCVACDKKVIFLATGPYFRNTLKCNSCRCGPRNLALFTVINQYFPNWRSLAIHESSPGKDLVSRRLAGECINYLASQFHPERERGKPYNSSIGVVQTEDLEHQTFADETFDLVITQDVFEHLFRPDLAIKEIARTLRPGGATIMTVPLVMGPKVSRRRASLSNGEISHHFPAEYHGNPVSAEGALVTIDWGYDLPLYLQVHSNLSFLMLKIEDLTRGIGGHLNEVIIGFKANVVDI